MDMDMFFQQKKTSTICKLLILKEPQMQDQSSSNAVNTRKKKNTTRGFISLNTGSVAFKSAVFNVAVPQFGCEDKNA